MLFNIDIQSNDFFDGGYEDIEVLSPQEGFTIGNMFFDLYVPYKNYKPGEVIAYTEKDKLMLKIQELSFAVNDLNLFLDSYPNNMKVFNLFKQYNIELNKCCEEYTEKYGPLLIDDDMKNDFAWVKGPWPWEGQNV